MMYPRLPSETLLIYAGVVIDEIRSAIRDDVSAL